MNTVREAARLRWYGPTEAYSSWSCVCWGIAYSSTMQVHQWHLGFFTCHKLLYFAFTHLQDVFWCACMHIALVYWPKQYVCSISAWNMWSVLVEEIRICIREPGETALSDLITVAIQCAETRHWTWDTAAEQCSTKWANRKKMLLVRKSIELSRWLFGQKYPWSLQGILD